MLELSHSRRGWADPAPIRPIDEFDADGGCLVWDEAPPSTTFRHLLSTFHHPDSRRANRPRLQARWPPYDSAAQLGLGPGRVDDPRSAGRSRSAPSGAKIGVKVKHHLVFLKDKDPNNRNARALRSAKNINKGNKQIAHRVNRVLRPIDL